MPVERFETGDRVTVVTVNKGLPHRQRAGFKARAVTWQGTISGPSMLGEGWWNVRRDRRGGGRVYAVPETEIRKAKT